MGHVTWSRPGFFSIKYKRKCAFPASCQWAGWTFSFLGFWPGCTLIGPTAQHPLGRGWRGRVFGSVFPAPEGRGGGREVGYSPDAWPAAHAGPRPKAPNRPPSPEAPPHRCCSTACARADWLWRGPISARLPRRLALQGGTGDFP